MSRRSALLQFADLPGKIYRLLTPAQRRQALAIGLLIVAVSVLDVLSLASIVPLLWLVFGRSSALLQQTGLSISLMLPLALGGWVVLFLLKNALGWWTSLQQNRFAYRLASRLSGEQFDRFFQETRGATLDEHSAKVLRRIHHVPVEFAAHVLLALLHMAAEGLIFLFLLAGLAVYQWQMLALLLALIVPLAVLFYWRQRQVLRRLGADLHQLAGEALRQLLETLGGWPEIRLYHRQEVFREAYLARQKRLNQCVAAFHSLNSLPPRFLEMAAVLAGAALVLAAHTLGYPPEKMVILLGLFTAAAYRLLPSMNRLSSAVMQLQTYRHTVDLLAEAPAGGQAAPSRPQPVPFRRSLVLEKVAFAYPGRSDFALREVDFRLDCGQTVGIVGSSGSGKTTLLLILMGLLEPRSGRVLVDGRPLTSHQVPGWQRQIGYVPQQPFLLDGTLLENIVFQPGVSREAVDQEALDFALQASGLGPWVETLPQGLDTPVGERGTGLSGGQRQRLVLARALYRRPRLLVLDEATSELDPASEAAILAALKRLQEKNLTMVIVSHRRSPLSLCHRAYRMESGRLVELAPAQEVW
ncbi:MAG: ABC transporter ATP-binding protein [Calditrichaeota bacterium]|nr:MAG: ABC transporter ATP-binding protein [Calditrichota bacterium]